MKVEATIRPGVPRLLDEGECARVLEAALAAAGAPDDAVVGLSLTDDDELAELNRAHMGKEGPTDVLSFPLLPPAAFPPHEGQDAGVRAAEGASGTPARFRLPPGEAVHLGDIVISVERAIEQAQGGAGGQTSDVRWSPEQELRLLITHGGLHLCGWDHATPAEEAAMRALEARLLGIRPTGSRGA